MDFDDFEDTDFSEWTMVQTVTTSTDQAYTGSNCSKQAGGAMVAAYLQKNALAYTNHSIRTAVFSSNGANDEGVVLWCDDNSDDEQVGG